VEWAGFGNAGDAIVEDDIFSPCVHMCEERGIAFLGFLRGAILFVLRLTFLFRGDRYLFFAPSPDQTHDLLKTFFFISQFQGERNSTEKEEKGSYEGGFNPGINHDPIFTFECRSNT
jgi:hypothetical protein